MKDDIDLIIFDCDGTLTDSENINNRALLEVLQEAGFTEFDLDYAYKNWVGTTVSSILLSIQMETGRQPPEDIVQKYIARVAELQMTGLVPIEGAPQLVASAREKFKICVASNGERRNVIESLRLVGILHNFHEDHVFTKIQVKNPKPYPDLFLYAAQKMGAQPERCLVIEDSGAGVRAGVAAGMKVFGFTGSSHKPAQQEEYLKAAGAHEIYNRLIHIQEALGL